MLRDARTVAPGETIETDICIIGAGPAGITIVKALEGAGCRITLLESGGTEHEPSTLELTKGEMEGHPHHAMHEIRAAGFGGSTSLWPEEDALRSRMLDPIDFEARDAVSHSGWPFSHDRLAPFYRRAQELCLLSPAPFDLASWEDTVSTPRLPLGEGRFHTTIFKFTKDISVFRNYLDDVLRSTTTTLYTHAHAVQLKLRPGGESIESAEVVGLWNTAFTVRSRVFVLAGGGIENVRLLLLSGQGSPPGIGNRHDLVGRFFMEHLRVSSGLLVPRNPYLIKRLGLYRRHFVNGWQMIGVLAPNEETVRAEGILNGVAYLRESDVVRSSDTFRSMAILKARLTGRKPAIGVPLKDHLRTVVRHPRDAWRALRHQSTGDGSPTLIELVFQTEQAPNPNSRVLLGETRDPLGFRRARLDWRLSDIDLSTIRRMQEILNDELVAAGIGKIERMLGEEQPPAIPKGHFHLMGTTRMHASPRQGVVDPNCLVHGAGNLYIAGSSVFPTGGYANPTLTIVALALRLADHIRSRLSTSIEVEGSHNP